MNVLWDLSYVAAKFAGGVELYSGDAIRGIYERGELNNYTFLVRNSAIESLMSLTDGKAKYIKLKNNRVIDWMAENMGHKGAFIAKCFYSDIRIKQVIKSLKKDFDLLVQPYARVQNARVKCMPVLMVIHDLLYYHTGNHNSVYYRWNDWFMKHIPKNTVGIVTISNFVKDDIRSAYPNIGQPIYIVPNAVSVDNRKKFERVISEPYILSVGVFLPHKNQITLLKAFNSIKGQIPHKLVFLGRHEKGIDTIKNYISENNLQDRVLLLETVSEEERNSLYQNAALFVTPSLNEGFGRTPIEAAMFNIPVISSDVTSLPEVTMGELFYYHPPKDDMALANKIIEVLNTPVSKDRFYEISEKLTKEYSREKIAEEWHNTLEKVINNMK